MAAPSGNQFWKLRSKHGREKLFKTPDLMWEAACEYFQWCDEHPWQKVDAAKAGDRFGELVTVPTTRPYTITGLCLYLNCGSSYFRQFKFDLPKNSEDFLTVIEAIEQTIYTQKFEGAAVGAFNANLISRDLGLADKQEIEIRDVVVDIPTDED